MQEDAFVLGVDYGTDSVRTVLVNARQGEEVAHAVFFYPRWRDGLFCDASLSQYRQHPLDYIEGLESTIRDCVKQAGAAARHIKAIAVDTTGSTPVAVDRQGVPLSLHTTFAKNPHAMFVLWKDHTAVAEAAEINQHNERFPENYLRFVGGIYSSEWFWAKLLRTLRVDAAVRGACYSWVEHCDWIPFLLTGGTDVKEMKRGVCAAGHKALWSPAWGGLPPASFFSALDPLLGQLAHPLFDKVFTSDQAAGRLSPEWAQRLGLTTEVLVGVGAFDAHMGAVGGQIEPYHLSKVMGTSTCDMLVAPSNEVQNRLVGGICGQVEGSIIPGMIGMEAGQSAFGDTYAWFKNLLTWPLQLLSQSALVDKSVAQQLQQETSKQIIRQLTRQAQTLTVTEGDELALDWLNGRRTPDANQALKAVVSGLHLGTDAPRMYKALVESTCFGARAIVDRFVREGIPVKGLIGLGGVAQQSPYVMQVMADVMNRPIRIHKSDQTCALGAAMFAATAAGIYPKVEEAMQAMGPGFDVEYRPDAKVTSVYEKRYQKFKKLSDMMADL